MAGCEEDRFKGGESVVIGIDDLGELLNFISKCFQKFCR